MNSQKARDTKSTKKDKKNIELDIGRPGETGKVLLSHGRSSGSKNIWKKGKKLGKKEGMTTVLN